MASGNQQRKRKYKNYMEPDGENEIPVMTKWRHDQRESHAQQQDECDEVDERVRDHHLGTDMTGNVAGGTDHDYPQHARVEGIIATGGSGSSNDENDDGVIEQDEIPSMQEDYFYDSFGGSDQELDDAHPVDSDTRSEQPGEELEETLQDDDGSVVSDDINQPDDHHTEDLHSSNLDEPIGSGLDEVDLAGYDSFHEDPGEELQEYHDAELWDEEHEEDNQGEPDEEYHDAELWDEEHNDEEDNQGEPDEAHGHVGEDEDDGEQFNFNDSLNEPLFAGSHISKAESLIMVLSFIMRHCLSSSAVTHLFELLNILLGTYIFKSTKCILRQIFCNNVIELTFHFYCTVCYSFVQSYDVVSEDEISCPHCTQPCMVKDLSHGNFFVTANLKSQVKALFERKDIYPHLSYRFTRQKVSPKNIEDIYDGQFYKKMTEDGKPLSEANNFSYTFNSDGLPVFQSSKYSLWPIYIMINELPPRIRMKNMLLAGVWFGKCEPKMEVFLEKFTHEANKLSEEGVFWKEEDDIKHSRLFGICCCADAPARSSMQNRIRFNGYYGCGLCYHPGKCIDRVVKYPIDVCQYNERSDEEMLQDMNQSLEEGRPVRGIKGPSPLINLSFFPICWGFPPDFMHCLLLGVMRQLADLWFASRATSAFYIGSVNIITTIDQRLKSIKPPSIVARVTRPISERKFWKASEWYNWLLFYCVPCLKGILPTPYLKHLTLLVEATFILLQKSIHIDELEKSDILLISFVCRFQILYGEAAMTYNLHCLTHLAKCVSLWGPMWTHSCFPYEAANWQVKRQLHGNRGVIMQVVKQFLLLQTLPLYIEHPAISPHVKHFCERMFQRRGKKAVLNEIFGTVETLGCGRSKICTAVERVALASLGHVTDENTQVLAYCRFLKNGMLFCTEGYRAGLVNARSNELIVLPENKVGKLFHIFLLNNQCVILFKQIILDEVAPFQDEESDSKITHIRQCIGLAPNLEAVNADEVVGNSIAMNVSETEYIAIFPNYVAIN